MNPIYLLLIFIQSLYLVWPLSADPCLYNVHTLNTTRVKVFSINFEGKIKICLSETRKRKEKDEEDAELRNEVFALVCMMTKFPRD